MRVPLGIDADLADRTVRALWTLLFPAPCLGCEGLLGPRDFGALCPSCRKGLPRLTPPLCDRCGLPLPAGPPCPDCAAHPPAFDAARAVMPYDLLCRDLVHAFKYDGRLRLASLFTELMSETYRGHADLLRAHALGEVPLASRDAAKRGRNHARELALGIARQTGIPHRPVLAKVRVTKPQAALDGKERARNVESAFTVRARNVPAHYLLIDDVLTTGATANACAVALRQGGAKRVTVLTLARTLPGDAQ